MDAMFPMVWLARGGAVLALAVLAVLGGCAPAEGDEFACRGTLLLKGSTSRPKVLLVPALGREWELQGVPPETLAALRDSQVEAVGTVSRVPHGEAMLVPAVKVMALRPLRERGGRGAIRP